MYARECCQLLLTAIGNVRDIVILKVKYPLGVFDNGASVRSNEVFNRLRKSIVREESARLGAHQVRVPVGDLQAANSRRVLGGLHARGCEETRVGHWKRNSSAHALRMRSV